MTKRWTPLLAGLGALTVLSLMPLVTHAQDPNAPEEAPKPAGRGYPPLVDTASDDQPSPDQLLPDSRPLTGVQNPTLGQVIIPHSYWEPGFQYSNTIQSSQPGESNPGWSTTNYLAANVVLMEASRWSQLALNYSGGGTFSTDKNQGNGYFHQVGVSQSLQWGRWQLQILDQFSYLPNSQFGFGGGTGLSLPGGGISSGVPQTGLTSNEQLLFTAVGPRYTNNFTTQAVYQISRRASVNVSGTYGILRFVDPGNIANNTVGASVGYNYALSKEDTIGLSYHFNRFTYIGESQSTTDQVISVVYGKKITGRLAFRAYGGPDITTFKVPLANTTQRTSVSGGANLTYQFSHVATTISYSHAVTPGSGVFTGSETDTIQAGATRPLGRVWRAQGNFGYARNRNIVSGAGVSAMAFDSWYVGGGVSRPLGPNSNISIAYSANIQTGSNSFGCTVPGCGGNYTQDQVTVNFQWHTRPLVLR